MHHCKYLILILVSLLPVKNFAQTTDPDKVDITGLWKGTLYHDSTRQYYQYEIGISEDKGKLSGFSHTWYNDSIKYFVVKKLQIRRVNGKVIIEDDDIIAYNYPESPPKGVRRLHVLTLELKDSILTLTGPFSTNRTKKYSSATGTINLQRKNDFWQSTLVPYLEDKGLEKELSFVVTDKEYIKKETEKKEKAASLQQARVAVVEPKPVVVKEIKPKETAKVPAKPLPKEKLIPAAPVIIMPAAEVKARKTIIQETMYFKSDSLELSLFDNGEVDGDTVSVLMNGTIIMAKQGLSTRAIRKTIMIPADADSVELIMYAENLGSIPPNTGLLVVKDGRDIYEIRFSGDLQKNAAIILKRRKPNVK